MLLFYTQHVTEKVIFCATTKKQIVNVIKVFREALLNITLIWKPVNNICFDT